MTRFRSGVSRADLPDCSMPIAEDDAARIRQLESRLAELEARCAAAAGRRADGERLHRSEARYRALVEVGDSFVWTADADGRSEDAARWFESFTGLAPRSPDERDFWYAAVHPDDRSRLEQEQPTSTRERRVLETTFRLRNAEGEYRHVQLRRVPVTDAGGAFCEWVGTLEDVTERRRAELVAEQSARKFQAMLGTAQSGYFLVDKTGKLLDVNEAYVRMSGYSRAELLELCIGDLEAKESHAEVLAHIALVCERGHDGFDSRHRRKDGSVFDVEIRATLVDAEEGRLVGFIWDVSERKRNEQRAALALAEAEQGRQTLEALMEHVPEGITIADAKDVRIRMISRHGRELLGDPRLALGQATAREQLERLEVYEADGVTRAEYDDLPLTRATRTGEIVRDAELVLGRPDGTRVRILCNAGPIRDESGAIVAGVVAWRDIGERKAAEEALRESEQRLRRSQEIAHLGSWELDLTNDRLFWSDEVYRIFGLEPGEFGASYEAFLEAVHPDDRAAVDGAYADSLRAGRDSYEIEHRIVRRRTGEVRVVHERCAHLRDATGTIVKSLGMVHDVTDRRRFEEELQAANARLREEDRRKNDFLAVLSHELRNPLTPIRNSLFILEHVAPGGEKARCAQQVIARQVAQLSRLVDDLLDMTRITRGKVQLKRERLDLCDVARRAVEDHRSSFAKSGVELELVDPGVPLWVDADRTRVAQIIGNLLANAAKFTDPGGSASVVVEKSTDGCEVIVRVRDTGVGIAPEMLQRLFEPFAQADTTLDRSKGGLGLGLSLVKGLLEMHGGEVSVRSEGLGRGAEVTVRLPLAVVATAELAPTGGAACGGARRVLIIEDNVDAADSLREILELGDHVVEVAYSGAHGIEKAHAFKPDVVLCDIGLPILDGYAVARAMRANPALGNVQLVALTGYALPEDVARAKAAGFDAHLAKPPEREALERTVAAVQAGRAPALARR